MIGRALTWIRRKVAKLRLAEEGRLRIYTRHAAAIRARHVELTGSANGARVRPFVPSRALRRAEWAMVRRERVAAVRRATA